MHFFIHVPRGRPCACDHPYPPPQRRATYPSCQCRLMRPSTIHPGSCCHPQATPPTCSSGPEGGHCPGSKLPPFSQPQKGELSAHLQSDTTRSHRKPTNESTGLLTPNPQHMPQTAQFPLPGCAPPLITCKPFQAAAASDLLHQGNPNSLPYSPGTNKMMPAPDA